MTPPCSNSFHLAGGHPRGTLASLLRPLRATLLPDGSAWTLRIAPMRLIDAITPWLGVEVDLGAQTLLLSASPHDSNASVLDDESLADVLARPYSGTRHAIRIVGPVEPADVEAIARGLREGRTALDAELRASYAMSMERDHCLRLDTRDPDAAYRFVAESFRHYVAALHNRPVGAIAAPEPWQIQRLLEIEGGLSVRPLETELYSTFIDIGVCVQADQPNRPADCSLIYDVYGNSWHDDS